MLFKVVVLVLLLLNWTWLATILLAANVGITVFGKRLFVQFLVKFTDKYNGMVDSFKKDLFSDLNNMGNKKEKIKVLEVGGGTGANFKYITRPANITVLEPNPFAVKFFDETRAKYPKLDVKEMVQGFGEDLAAAGFEDESFDAVIVTLVFCSVQDTKKCLQEIKRVLKPGGKLFYLEHVVEKTDPTRIFLQKALTESGFWPFMTDGCNLHRDTGAEVEAAGYTKVDQKHFDLPKSDKTPALMQYFIRPHLMGVATK